MINNTTKWILRDGLQTIDCSSFPYAYRTMFSIMKKGVEKGRKFDDMKTKMSITGPVSPGAKAVRYSYEEATAKATAQGLVNGDGNIDQREFKKKH